MQFNIPKWAEPLLQPARYKGTYGGRGSGKSHTYAELLLLAHILDPGTSSVCIREVQKSIAQSVKRLLENKIDEHELYPYFEVLESVIRNKRGRGVITFQGMQNHTADSIKSLEGYDRAWVEEAQSLSQRSLDLLRPTIRQGGSELWFSWNPEEPTDPIDLLLRGENLPPDAIVIQANFTENPWFPEVLRAEMEFDKIRDPFKYRHVWLGEYNQRKEALVFRNWRIQEFDTDPHAEFMFGGDFGFSEDPAAGVRCYVKGRQLFIDSEVHGNQVETLDLPAFFSKLPDISRWVSIFDSARPETISHLQRHGLPKAKKAVKGAGSVEDGIEFLRSYDIIVHPRCQHTATEFSKYSYKISKHTGHVLPELEDKDNHHIDSLRYAIEPLRRRRPTMRVI